MLEQQVPSNELTFLKGFEGRILSENRLSFQTFAPLVVGGEGAVYLVCICKTVKLPTYQQSRNMDTGPPKLQNFCTKAIFANILVLCYIQASSNCVSYAGKQTHNPYEGYWNWRS